MWVKKKGEKKIFNIQKQKQRKKLKPRKKRTE